PDRDPPPGWLDSRHAALLAEITADPTTGATTARRPWPACLADRLWAARPRVGPPAGGRHRAGHTPPTGPLPQTELEHPTTPVRSKGPDTPVPGDGPGTPVRRWRLVLAVVPTAVLAVALIVVVLLANVVGERPRYASWTAIPDSVGSAETQALVAQCRARLARVPTAEPDALAPVLAERRGDVRAVLLTGPPGYGICIGADGGHLAGVQERSSAPPGTPLVLDGAPGQVNGPDAVRAAYGQAGPDVRRVVITTADGLAVTASLADGAFLAWWPSGADPVTVTGYDAAGHVTAELHPGPGGTAPVPTGQPS